MSHSIGEIAQALGLQVAGDASVRIKAVAEPGDAGTDDLALAMKPDFAADLGKGAARAAMLWADADWQSMGLEGAILAPRPRHALSGLSRMLDRGPGFEPGIHPSAVIHETAVLGADVSVGPFTVIGRDVRIGAGSVIGPQCHIGEGSVLGVQAELRDGVRIGARITIGDRFICQPGAVIGADGFSFVTPEQSAVERARDSLGDQGEISAQAWARIHSLGAVTIGDDCEVGANSCIDRGTVRDTKIGNGTKLDNLVQVGHNVVIGDSCLLCAQVGVAGSTRLGNNVVLGGQTGVGDNLTIGDNVITGGGTKVLSKVPSGRVMLGYPAVQMQKHIEIYKAMRRLPRLFSDVAALQKSVPKADENS